MKEEAASKCWHMRTVGEHRRVGEKFGVRVSGLGRWLADCVQMDIERIVSRMASKKAGTKPGGNAVEWRGFVPYHMSLEDKKRFREWQKSEDWSIEECLQHLCADGFKVTVRYLAEKNSYSCSITGADNSNGWCGYTHSSFAGEIDVAIRLMYFKYNLLWSAPKSPEEISQEVDDIG